MAFHLPNMPSAKALGKQAMRPPQYYARPNINNAHILSDFNQGKSYIPYRPEWFNCLQDLPINHAYTLSRSSQAANNAPHISEWADLWQGVAVDDVPTLSGSSQEKSYNPQNPAYGLIQKGASQHVAIDHAHHPSSPNKVESDVLQLRDWEDFIQNNASFKMAMQDFDQAAINSAAVGKAQRSAALEAAAAQQPQPSAQDEFIVIPDDDDPVASVCQQPQQSAEEASAPLHPQNSADDPMVIDDEVEAPAPPQPQQSALELTVVTADSVPVPAPQTRKRSADEAMIDVDSIAPVQPKPKRQKRPAEPVRRAHQMQQDLNDYNAQVYPHRRIKNLAFANACGIKRRQKPEPTSCHLADDSDNQKTPDEKTAEQLAAEQQDRDMEAALLAEFEKEM